VVVVVVVVEEEATSVCDGWTRPCNPLSNQREQRVPSRCCDVEQKNAVLVIIQPSCSLPLSIGECLRCEVWFECLDLLECRFGRGTWLARLRYHVRTLVRFHELLRLLVRRGGSLHGVRNEIVVELRLLVQLERLVVRRSGLHVHADLRAAILALMPGGDVEMLRCKRRMHTLMIAMIDVILRGRLPRDSRCGIVERFTRARRLEELWLHPFDLLCVHERGRCACEAREQREEYNRTHGCFLFYNNNHYNHSNIICILIISLDVFK